jgi:hypothetical protein
LLPPISSPLLPETNFTPQLTIYAPTLHAAGRNALKPLDQGTRRGTEAVISRAAIKA